MRLWKFWRQVAPALPEVVVATALYETVFCDEKRVPTGEKFHHVVVFFSCGEIKESRVETHSHHSADSHTSIRRDRAAWRYHGELPAYAKRVVSKGNVVKLSLVAAAHSERPNVEEPHVRHD